MSAYFSARDEQDTETHLSILGDFKDILYYIRIIVGSDGLVADVHQRQENGSWTRDVIDHILLYRRKGMDVIVPNNSAAQYNPVIDKELHNRTLQIGGGIDKALGMINDCTMLVIGAGGIGNTFLELYKHLNPGKLVIVDDDVFERANANHFLGYRPGDEGKTKVEIIRRELLQFNPDMEIETYQERFPSEGSLEAFKSSDIVIASVDNHGTRLIASRHANTVSSFYRPAQAYTWMKMRIHIDCHVRFGYSCRRPWGPASDAWAYALILLLNTRRW